MSFILIVASFVLLAAGEGTVRAADPIKIGFMAPYVGTWSKFGGDLRDGFKLALEEAGYNVAGRQIIFVEEESLLKVF